MFPAAWQTCWMLTASARAHQLRTLPVPLKHSSQQQGSLSSRSPCSLCTTSCTFSILATTSRCAAATTAAASSSRFASIDSVLTTITTSSRVRYLTQPHAPSPTLPCTDSSRAGLSQNAGSLCQSTPAWDAACVLQRPLSAAAAAAKGRLSLNLGARPSSPSCTGFLIGTRSSNQLWQQYYSSYSGCRNYNRSHPRPQHPRHHHHHQTSHLISTRNVSSSSSSSSDCITSTTGNTSPTSGTSSNSPCSITTLSDLAAVFKPASNSRGPAQKLTIDLGGRTISGSQVPGDELLLAGNHAHVCLVNGTSHLLDSCQLVVDHGATLEMTGMHLISQGCAGEEGWRPAIVYVSYENTRLIMKDCTIKWVEPQEEPMIPNAVLVMSKAQATLTRCWIEDVAIGAWVIGEGSNAVVDRCGVWRCSRGYLGESWCYFAGLPLCSSQQSLFWIWGTGAGSVMMRAVGCRSEGNVDVGFYAGLTAVLQTEGCVASGNGWRDFHADTGAEVKVSGPPCPDQGL